MAIRVTRIKFIWGASRVIVARWRFGLWGFYERKLGYPDSGLVISIRGLLVLCGLLLVTAYLGGVTTVYLRLDRKGHNYVTYTDVLLLPLRVDAVKAKQIQGQIDAAIANLNANPTPEAEAKLRLGLRKYPQALRARLALAGYYADNQQAGRALSILSEGMDITPDYPGRRYLNDYIMIAMQAADYAGVLAATARYLDNPSVRLTAKEHDWLLRQKIAALIQDHRAAQALGLIESIPDNAFLIDQHILALLALDRPAEAKPYLAAWRTRAGATVHILRLQAQVDRELGDSAGMNTALEELRKLSPADPNAHAFAIIQRKLMGNDQAALDSMGDYFRQFGAFAANTLLLAHSLAEIGAVNMLQTCVQRATKEDYDLRPYLLLLAQAQLRQGQWLEARQTTWRLSEMSTMGRTARELHAAELTALLADVAADPQEGPQISLLKHIESRDYIFQTYRMIVDTLMRAQRYAAALEVIARAEQRFPQNGSLAGDKARASAILNPLTASAEGHSTLPVFVEQVFFDRVDQAMGERQWSRAGAMIRDVQAARPVWLKSREADVLNRQMRVARGAQSLLEMSLAARLLLDGTLVRSQIVVDYAVELHNQGDTDAAVLLLREVTRRMPSHALARRYLQDWTSKPSDAVQKPAVIPTVKPIAAPPAG